jgi:acyl-CoA synthetase (AMP-forming)/AMP-acid ligase II
VNIASHLKEMAEQRPTQLAVMYPASRDRSGQVQYIENTYQQLHEKSDLLAAGLDQIGIGRGTKTVLMVPPSLEFFSLTFALFKAGAVPVFVDPGMGIKNLGKCLAEADPDAFIGISKAHVARLLFRWGTRSVTKLVTVGRRIGWGGLNLDQVAEIGRSRQSDPSPVDQRWHPAETETNETAAILFTSGSTGVPKGAVYSHGNFAAQVAALKKAFGIEPGEIDLCTFPLFALFAPALGMTAVIPRMDFTKPATVNPLEVIEPIVRFGIKNLFGSPALLNRVGRDAAVSVSQIEPGSFTRNSTQNATSTDTATATVRLPSLKRVLSAGAPVSPAILERFSGFLAADTQIFTPYGATESLPVAIIGSHEILSETRFMTAQGAGTCVGRPVESIHVEIIRISDDPIAEWHDDLRVPRGEVGEIVVHGPMVTQEYFRRPDLTALAKIRDPQTGRMRHRMGDVGYIDEQGRLWFCGRKSHRVVTLLRTYFTECVEGIFNTHRSVFRTALVGVARNGIIQPVLCVERESRQSSQGEPWLTDTDLQEELLKLGEQFELTREIKTIRFHPNFPVDIRHNSKIFREKLAAWASK